MTTKKSLPILVGAILFCVNMSADAVTTSIMAVTGGGALNNLENNAFYSINTTGPEGRLKKGVSHLLATQQKSKGIG